MNIYFAYISKHNLCCENQITYLLIPNREKWSYLAVININTIKRNSFKTR